MTGLPDPRPILTRALAEARARAPLAAELQRAQRDFFGGTMPLYAKDPQSLAAAEARFAEWFLLERSADTLGAPPVELVEEEHREWLLDSRVGVFLVDRAGPSDRVWVRDLQTDAMIELDPSASGGDLAPGAVLIGRLFGADPAWPSPTCVVRGESSEFARALRADFEALALPRRLDQAEIEHLVFRKFAAEEPAPIEVEEPLERLEARLQSLFARGGFTEVSAEDVCASLEVADSVGAVAAPLLERVAFESSVDLAACQELLVKLFDAQRRGRPTAAAPGAPREVRTGSTPRLGADLVRHLEEGLAGNRDLETVFAEMARMAGIDPAELDEDTEVEPDLDDDRGGPEGGPFLDLAPLVQEFLWETGDGAQDRQVLEGLVQLTSGLPVAVGQFEDLTSEHFLRLMLRGWLAAPPASRVAALAAIQASLERFVQWAFDEQDMDRTRALAECGPAFVEHAERMARAADVLSGGADGGAGDRPPPRPALWRVEQVEADFFCVRRDDGDGTAVLHGKTAAGSLAVGDLLVGQLGSDDSGSPAFHGMVVVLPAAAEGLLA